MTRLRALALYTAAQITLAGGLSAAVIAFGQGPVDCSLLTPEQARGLTCVVPAREIGPPLADSPSAADCDPRPNPYAEPARAARCIAWERTQQPPPPLPTFTTGATYVSPYSNRRILVLAVTLGSTGVPVVTAEYTTGPHAGTVFAFRVDQGQPWTLVP